MAVQREDFLLFYVFLEDRLGKVKGRELVALLWPGDTSKIRQKRLNAWHPRPEQSAAVRSEKKVCQTTSFLDIR